ncbi:phospholipid-transporting ATPase ABCA3-like isoform X1 [Tenebrio molitor]|uniref:phospholipid-transporting ATPase ABCA3-like isoform X1 n=1 Tax=Tenebrio molitor TaxID=7067 RepID=UPI0036247FE5
MWRELKLILWKNLLIRKRHWVLTLTEILIPILLFTLIAYGRSKISGLKKIEIKDSTYHEKSEIDEIFAHLAVGEISLWYSPYTDFTEDIILRVQEKFQIPGEAIREFNSKEDLLKQFGKNTTATIAAVNFIGNDSIRLNYEIGMYDKYFRWNTDKLFMPTIIEDDAKASKYIIKGFAALQVAIDQAFIEMHLSENDNKYKNLILSIQQFPDPPHTLDSGLNQLFIYFLPLSTIFSFIFLCPAVLQRVGEDKCSGTKEFLKMVGMKSWMLWLGWLIHALLTNLFSIVVVIILMKVPFWGVAYPPIEFSNGVILFLFLFFYCMAAITFCFLIATIMNKPSIATVVGILFWIFSYFVPHTIVTSYENLQWKYKIMFALFPNMALQYGYSAVSVYEMRETGIQWNNMIQSGSGGEDDITMGNVLLMLIFDTVIFMLLTLYIENVKPGEYGIAKPYNFFLPNLKSFQCFCKIFGHSDADPLLDETEIPENICIQINKLFKKYNHTVAVDNLSMNIRENKITVLLGHNGAGKTTTMSILTGMINATKGTVIINGKDIKKETDQVRKDTGLCPQHNLLFMDLTVREHLKLIAMLKGSNNIDCEVKNLLVELDLDEKANSMACTLSGGMKRKLCLGMALIGNSKVLILDEPTSGMDPESRRKIWNLLLEYRKTKTILISTHFMEEADILGDRIAIMANGSLQCYDTPMRLKVQYNTGYHLSLMLASKKYLDIISREIKKQVLGTHLLRENSDTVVYLLPLSEKYKYRAVFELLEKNKNQWNIAAISLNITTLNDVFLKAKDEIDGKNREVDGTNDNDLEKMSSKLPTFRRRYNIFTSLMKKRFYFMKRKFYWYIPAILVTISIFLLAMWLSMAGNVYSNNEDPQLSLSLHVYGKTKVYYGGNQSSDATVLKMRELYSEAVLREGGSPVLEEDVAEGIIGTGIANIAFYKQHMITAAEFNDINDEIFVNSMYSKNALHGVPISINLATNAIVKALFNESFSITISNTPLKPLYTEFSPSELSLINVTSIWFILMPLSMLFFMSNFIIFPNLETSTNFIHIQTLAGVRIGVYWFINILYDLISVILLILPLLASICLMDVLAYESVVFKSSEIWTFFTIFLCYVIGSLPLVYIFSYRKTLSSGFTSFLMYGMFIGLTPTIIIYMMEFSNDDYYVKFASFLKHGLLPVFPQFGLSYICVKFSRKYVENFNWEYMDPNKRKHICETDPNPCCGGPSAQCENYKDYFSNEKLGIGKDLLEMTISSFALYFILLLFFNSKLYQKMLHYLKYSIETVGSCCCRTSNAENSMSSTENDKQTTSSKTLHVQNLTKSFGRKQIVKNLKFNVVKNKCLGLLGVNGAGKSTTFQMLTKHLFFDKGQIAISEGSKSTSISKDEYSEKIGYCPQEDCLNYYLTGRELLYVIAHIKGYSNKDADEIIKALLNRFDLNKYADKPCLEYSGGNKRKLNCCLAFLGLPSVILLDEPTSGVDPASRRNFWKIFSYFKEHLDTSFLLSSHSMEECENLCDEVAIMKNGKIEDQGNLLTLKSKYQNGYKLTIKLNSGAGDTAPIKDSIKSVLDADLQEEYAESLEFHVKNAAKRLSGIFSLLEELKENYTDIEDYVIGEISLEDIFLTVSEKKEEV